MSLGTRLISEALEMGRDLVSRASLTRETRRDRRKKYLSRYLKFLYLLLFVSIPTLLGFAISVGYQLTGYDTAGDETKGDCINVSVAGESDKYRNYGDCSTKCGYPTSRIEGHLYLPTQVDACSYIHPPPGGFPTNSTWIALVYNYPSCPSDMVINVRNAGYKCIIAASDRDSRTIVKEVCDTLFPVVVVEQQYADYLKEYFLSTSADDPIIVSVRGTEYEIYNFYFALGVVCMIALTVSGFAVSCRCCYIARGRRCCCCCYTRGECWCCCTGCQCLKCGNQKHLWEVKYWRRNFERKSCVVGMDDFINNQPEYLLPRHCIASELCNLITSDFKEEALRIFIYPNSCSVEQDSALQLLSQNPNGVTACIQRNQYFGIFLLHNACLNGWCDVVKKLVENGNCCDPKVNIYPTSSSIHSKIFAFLLKVLHSLLLDPDKLHKSVRLRIYRKEELEESLNISAGTAIHCACKAGHLDIVKFLIEQGCDPECKNTVGATPLHFACWEGHLDSVKFLVDEKGCDATCTAAGFTPLHLACWKGHLDIVKFLVERDRDPRSAYSKGYTPLHIACEYGHLNVVKFLVEEQHFNHLQPAAKKSSVTPLDLANLHNHLSVSSFLTSPGVSRQARYEYLSRLSFPPAFKVFVMGNHSVGKSTLVKAIENRLTNTKWFGSFTDRFKRVSGVELNTAGIIPISIDSKRLGNIILYDLAGQHEYYSSHAALLDKLVAYPGSLLMVVVDLSEDKNMIIQQLQYWNSFIESHCSQSDSKPDVVIVGSHADVVKSQLENPKEKSTDILQTVPSNLQMPREIITLNCTQLASDGLNEVCAVIDNYCSQFRQEVSTDTRLNFLHAFLCQDFEGVTACKVSEIVSQISREEWDVETVSQYLTTVSDKSQFLYLRNDQDVTDSWVILDQGVLLSEVDGTIFAPKDFKEHHDISSSTGVVQFSRIKESFPERDPEMIVSFMSHLEFCHEIAESEAALIHGSQLGDSQQQFEKLYFFPALVNVDRPKESCISIEQTHYKCGWSLQSIRPDQFLSLRFLHVLLLRLAFSFALAPEEDKACPVLRRRSCDVWKAGIHWVNQDGVETIVEVVEQNTAVTVLMECLRGTEMACVGLRSELIQTILEVKERFCRAVELKESLIHPAELSSYPLRNSNLLSSFTTTELATAIANDKQVVTSKQGRHLKKLDISELLYFEPYACFNSKLLSQLFKAENSSKEIPDVFYNDAGKVAHTKIELLTQALEFNKSEYEAAIKTAPEPYRDSKMHHCYLLFRTWALCSPNPTYQALRSALDKFSVLCGRNPLLVLKTGLIQSSVGTANIDKSLPTRRSYDHEDDHSTTGLIQSCKGTADLLNEDKSLPTRRSCDHKDDLSTIPHRTHATRKSHDEDDFTTIPHITDRPHLGELQYLQGRRGRRVKVIEGVATKWEELAKALHFDSGVIELMRDTEDACWDILRRWLEGEEGTRQPVTWATLIDSLHEAGFVDIATDLQEAVEDYAIDVDITFMV